MNDSKQEIDEYLAGIRKTIAESEAAIQQAELRFQETDRLLEAQGLTREQVLNLRISQEQRRLVNDELKRRGLPLLEDDEFNDPVSPSPPLDLDLPDTQGDLENRRRRFGNMMQQYRL